MDFALRVLFTKLVLEILQHNEQRGKSEQGQKENVWKNVDKIKIFDGIFPCLVGGEVEL